MINIYIELDEQLLKKLVMDHLKDQLGQIELDQRKLRIEVKSKQNYKSEWEPAAYRAVYEENK